MWTIHSWDPSTAAPKFIVKDKASRRFAHEKDLRDSSEEGHTRVDTRRFAGCLFLFPCRDGAKWKPDRASARRVGTKEQLAASIQRSAKGHPKNHMFPSACFVKMSYFAIDFCIEMPYPLAPPQG
jgi:hypothetical protein